MRYVLCEVAWLDMLQFSISGKYRCGITWRTDAPVRIVGWTRKTEQVCPPDSLLSSTTRTSNSHRAAALECDSGTEGRANAPRLPARARRRDPSYRGGRPQHLAGPGHSGRLSPRTSRVSPSPSGLGTRIGGLTATTLHGRLRLPAHPAYRPDGVKVASRMPMQARYYSPQLHSPLPDRTDFDT